MQEGGARKAYEVIAKDPTAFEKLDAITKHNVALTLA